VRSNPRTANKTKQTKKKPTKQIQKDLRMSTDSGKFTDLERFGEELPKHRTMSSA
jgi:hypothetical protein